MMGWNNVDGAFVKDHSNVQVLYSNGRQKREIGLDSFKQSEMAPSRPFTGAEPKNIANFVRSIAVALVDDPDSVNVTEVVGDQTLVVELKVAKSDVGKIIGRSGRNADAIRALLTAASSRYFKRAVLEIIE